MDTVRKVRSLKEPVFSEGDYSKKLAGKVLGQLSDKKPGRKKRGIWAAAAAAVSCYFGTFIKLCTIS